MKTPIKPMLAKLTPASPIMFAREGMTWEPKWDGYRMIVEAREGQPTVLWARSGKALDYPHLADRIAFSGVSAILDGEIVVFRDGHPSFNALQLAKGMSADAAMETMRFMAFDVLEVNGVEVYRQPLSERRELLRSVVDVIDSQMVDLTPSLADGNALWTAIELADMEGMIGKPLNAPYRFGERGTWMKIKRTVTREFTIVGWLYGSGKRDGEIGALVLAVEQEGRLLYAGKVGTGFNEESLRTVLDALQAQRLPTVPLDDLVRAKAALGAGYKDVTWVRPVHKATVEYADTGPDGIPRFPSFKGMT